MTWGRNPIFSAGIFNRAPSPPDPNPADFRRSGIELRFYIVAPVSKFEVQIDDTAQYRGKKAPHGKKGDGVEPVSHHKKQQRQNTKDIDYPVA
jgi:hypothetical protein